MPRSHLSLVLGSLLLAIACEPASAASEPTPAPAPAQTAAPITTSALAQPSAITPRVAAEPRPKTIAEARDRLLAIGSSGDLSKIAALADLERGLEFTHEDRRVWRMRLRPDDPAGMARLFASTDPEHEHVRKVSLLASASAAKMQAEEGALTVVYRADGAKLDFVFERLGDALVLVRITS